MAARDRAVHASVGPGHRRPAAQPRTRHSRRRAFFKITNYDTVYRDLDLIAGWSPDLVVLDEAQRIKNWTTRTARSVKKIAAPYAVVLTGTPLENRLEELISIVQFVDRYRLGPTFRLLHEHQVRDPVGKVVGYTRPRPHRPDAGADPGAAAQGRSARSVARPHRQQRLRAMTDLQRKHHTENREIVARIVQKWRRYRFLSEADQRRLMIALHACACRATAAISWTTRATRARSRTRRRRCWTNCSSGRAPRRWCSASGCGCTNCSAAARGPAVGPRPVSRRRSGAKRKDLVDRFREDPKCRAFLSTDAGGVGLNLQHASIVLNMDLPWNPAVLEQRIGRVHRLGQRQPVRVVNFVAQGTIEEGMLSVLRFKKSLFAGVLDGGETEVFLGGSRLNKFMETVESATKSIPEAMAQDTAETPEPAPSDGAGGVQHGEPGCVSARGSAGRSVVGAVAGGNGVVAAVRGNGVGRLRGVAGPARRAHGRDVPQDSGAETGGAGSGAASGSGAVAGVAEVRFAGRLAATRQRSAWG